jgi:hypothetical protein
MLLPLVRITVFARKVISKEQSTFIYLYKIFTRFYIHRKDSYILRNNLKAVFSNNIIFWNKHKYVKKR